MIRSLTGVITATDEQTAVVDVNGIGYLVFTPHPETLKLKDEVLLHTHLAVRENALDLYGFSLRDELVMFEQLLTLPKIGPKSALQILSQANLELIKTAVVTNDANHLSKVGGLGKKTAEKVVVGLGDLYEKLGLMDEPVSVNSGAEQSHARDTIDALITLGYPEHDARKAVQSVQETRPELTNTNAILKEALKLLSQA